jgi:hypothetical protein
MCSDGSKEDNSSAHGWVISSSTGTIFAKGSGPVDGHTDLLSSFWSELCGLLALLYILHFICYCYNIQASSAKLFCDNKGALAHFFRNRYTGITPYLFSDYDIIMLAHNLLTVLPITIHSSWVKGHYSGKSPKLEHKLNHIADSLATSHKNSTPNSMTKKLPLMSPSFKVHLHYGGSIITSSLSKILYKSMHDHIIC